jgi:hypothetical protein
VAHISFASRFPPENSRNPNRGPAPRPAACTPWPSLWLEPLEDRIAPAVITPFNVRFTANGTQPRLGFAIDFLPKNSRKGGGP